MTSLLSSSFLLEIQKEPFGNEKIVYNNQEKLPNLFHIRHKFKGWNVSFTDFGAIIQKIQIENKNNKLIDIVLGHDSPKEYILYGGYFGSIVGRVCNRISNGKFYLEEKEYHLFQNQNKNCLHGGKEGFDKKIWNCNKFEILNIQNIETAILELEYISIDGEEGFPGTLTCIVRYFVSSNFELWWEIEAFTTETTIVNLTNHTYWNIDDLENTIDNLEIKINASKYMAVDNNCLATGEIINLSDTFLKDVNQKRISLGNIFKYFGDIDNTFFLNHEKNIDKFINNFEKNQKLILASELYSKKNGILMSIYTTEPCVQIYTGNFLNENMKSFNKKCQKHGAICFETQRPPNAINLEPYKNTVILKPGNIYYQKTIHKFTHN